ncbi:sulfur carrier protein ThiS [Promicromonospora sp. NPDC060271]|uniref:sulfur carrier protein ThiS n=1 Tax=Promicromonospora sp. NPDC060271 TaxID=3347089 RepID=UPI00365AE0B9
MTTAPPTTTSGASGAAGARGDSAPGAVVNGEPYPLDGPLPIADLVARLLPGLVVDGAPRGVAVALDDAVVPRSAWSTTYVRPGDRVEVVTAVQGG